ncbi:uncharacterized protein LOC113333241 [Papaver somniferum]|uniref:uncharacterized protein LOC113333241 n=1 Tax=Papaver somniferum TaxID=3469 RepID=UPI000E7018AE|nr:uncharacterized protein LOC113333241 [Papaver somniferum]
MVISNTKQAITVDVGGHLVTGVHADTLTINRRVFWEELSVIATFNKPWMIIGYFNAVLSMEEKRGGRNPLTTSMLEFNNCIQSCKMIQAPKTCLEFSWCNNRSGKKRIVCNLDRDFYNAQWLNSYPSWGYKVGTRGTSDHSPLFGTNATIPKPANVPFGSLKVWMSHEDFKKVIEEAWRTEVRGNPGFIFLTKLKHIKVILKKWNWVVFGDVNQKLKKADEEVLKHSLISDQSLHNTTLLNNLVTSRGVQEILTQQKQEIERQKARVKWLKFGVVNTKFFHVNMKIRQMHNAIVKLEKDDGELVSTQQAIDDILEIFELDPDSSPGPDGFGGWFYRMAWEILSEDFIRAIQYCWEKEFIPTGMNSNFIMLLPKIKNTRKPNQYRPIGLMNFSFKVITKIITSRLSHMVQKIVSPQQGAFIKGRSIQDQIVLASEMINELETKRRGGNSAKISILVNEGPVGYFNVSRGLRQGDPLSPILFVIAEDVLSRRLTSLVMQGKLKPMIQRNGVHPTHIMFADDIFLFCNGEKRNLQRLIQILDEYQNVSVYKWPRKVLKESEKIIRNFLWSGDPSIKKTVTLKWEKTCAPLAEGGLEIKWVSAEVAEHPRWLDGDGTEISVWDDVWINEKSSKDTFPENNIMVQNQDMKVADLIKDGEWQIPSNFFQFFVATDLPVIDQKGDKRIWSATSSGKFSVASAYNCIRKKFQPVNWANTVWHKSVHPNVSSNVWKILRGVVPTDETMNKKKFQIASRCPFCKKEEENLEHILWFCEFSELTWRWLGEETQGMLDLVLYADKALENTFMQCQSDSQAAIAAFQSGEIPWWACTRWNKIKSTLQEWYFTHSYRETNFSADSMAKRGAGLAKG